MNISPSSTPREVVQAYFESGFHPVFWPAVGDAKGPHEKGWNSKDKINSYTLADYSEDKRVGLMTGGEVKPGRFLHDVDIDWAPGAKIALNFLPATDFVFGRPSKTISHCFYYLPEPIYVPPYKDVGEGKAVNGITLIELRGPTKEGEEGNQTMVPPSIWSKEGKHEQLAFARFGEPAFIENVMLARQAVCMSAIGMLFAKHFGINGFGHESRLAWAGFLLRAGIPIDDLVKMGEAISIYCNNREISDVRRVVESTAAALTVGSKKVKGGPSLIKLLGEKGKAIIARVNEWLDRDSDFVRTGGMIVKDHQGNIARAMQLLDVGVSYQEFNERILVHAEGKTKTMDDAVMDSLWLRIDREYWFRPSYQFFEKVIRNIAHEAPFHPVRDYLADLVWDKVPRLDTWLTTYANAEDTPYIRAISKIVLVAAVRRVRQPGCKYDEMVVLESSQGLNKSSALRALCPNDEWFSDDLPLNVDAKQVIERTLGKWIIEASDLAGKRRADIEQLKSMLSRQIDGPARLAYARNPVERARQFILIGTTNASVYLQDPTGARRFWPISVQAFDVAGILRDRDQLWAEAAYQEAHGASIRLSEDLWGTAGAEQEKRQAHDSWEGVLRTYLLGLTPYTDGKRRVATDDLWTALAIEIGRRDRLGGMRIADIMQKFGFRPSTIRLANQPVQRGYVSEDEKLLEIDPEREPGEDPPF
jgi:hypothetical protein